MHVSSVLQPCFCSPPWSPQAPCSLPSAGAQVATHYFYYYLPRCSPAGSADLCPSPPCLLLVQPIQRIHSRWNHQLQKVDRNSNPQKIVWNESFQKQGVRNDSLQNFQENNPVQLVGRKVATICKIVVRNIHIQVCNKKSSKTTVCQIR